MEKNCSAADAAVAYVSLVVVSNGLTDWSKDATAEAYPEPPTNLPLDNMGGDSHGGKI